MAIPSLFPPATLDRIRSCKLLVVGAGGIGCELLKSLVLTGFQHLTVVFPSGAIVSL